MEKLKVDIQEKGDVCVLSQDNDQKTVIDDCEKLLYLAMAEGKNHPTEIHLKKSDGTTRKTLFVPESFFQQELQNRKTLLFTIGKYLEQVLQLPEEVCHRYFDDNLIDELYDQVMILLEVQNGGNVREFSQTSDERGDDIQKRDKIVHLTADFLHFYGLASPIILADFYNYPESVSVTRLIDNLEELIAQKQSEVLVVYVVDSPFTEEDLNTEMLPVFVEENGYLKITAWIAPEVIPQNLVPVFNIEQRLIGWLDRTSSDGASD